jgi:hypothetical protein
MRTAWRAVRYNGNNPAWGRSTLRFESSEGDRTGRGSASPGFANRSRECRKPSYYYRTIHNQDSTWHSTMSRIGSRGFRRSIAIPCFFVSRFVSLTSKGSLKYWDTWIAHIWKRSRKHFALSWGCRFWRTYSLVQRR